MFDIKIINKKGAEGGLIFEVEIVEGESKTFHTVELSTADYQRLTKGKITPEELVEKSFEFLLEREPKESILGEFNLRLIGKYFPEYEKEILSS